MNLLVGFWGRRFSLCGKFLLFVKLKSFFYILAGKCAFFAFLKKNVSFLLVLKEKMKNFDLF
jgi:hypothetical protein